MRVLSVLVALLLPLEATAQFFDPSALNRSIQNSLNKSARRGEAQSSLVARDIPGVDAPWRTWTDSGGRRSIIARFVERKDASIVLQQEDGRLLTLKIRQLTRKDREWIQKYESETTTRKKIGEADGETKAGDLAVGSIWKGRSVHTKGPSAGDGYVAVVITIRSRDGNDFVADFDWTHFHERGVDEATEEIRGTVKAETVEWTGAKSKAKASGKVAGGEWRFTWEQPPYGGEATLQYANARADSK